MIFIYILLFKNESSKKYKSAGVRRIGAEHPHRNDTGRLWGGNNIDQKSLLNLIFS
jgi:hypothetical protein